MNATIPRVEDLPAWPVYDEPYIVEDALGTYIETIAPGADEHALLMDIGSTRVCHGSMRVVEDEWNADYTERRVLTVSTICPRAI
jgi:hypothetical protein